MVFYFAINVASTSRNLSSTICVGTVWNFSFLCEKLTLIRQQQEHTRLAADLVLLLTFWRLVAMIWAKCNFTKRVVVGRGGRWAEIDLAAYFSTNR